MIGRFRVCLKRDEDKGVNKPTVTDNISKVITPEKVPSNEWELKKRSKEELSDEEPKEELENGFDTEEGKDGKMNSKKRSQRRKRRKSLSRRESRVARPRGSSTRKKKRKRSIQFKQN